MVSCLDKKGALDLTDLLSYEVVCECLETQPSQVHFPSVSSNDASSPSIHFALKRGVVSAVVLIADAMKVPMPNFSALVADDAMWYSRLNTIANHFSDPKPRTLAGPVSAMDAYMYLHYEIMEGGPTRWFEGMSKGTFFGRNPEGGPIYATTPKELQHSKKRSGGKYWDRPAFMTQLLKELAIFKSEVWIRNETLDVHLGIETADPWVKALVITQMVVNSVTLCLSMQLVAYLKLNTGVAKYPSGKLKAKVGGCGVEWVATSNVDRTGATQLQAWNDLLLERGINTSFTKSFLPRCAGGGLKLGAFETFLGRKRKEVEEGKEVDNKSVAIASELTAVVKTWGEPGEFEWKGN